jgi:hypothetical protein
MTDARIELRLDVDAECGDDPRHDLEIHAAHELSMLFCERVERAVAEPNHGLVVERLVPALA